MHKHRVVILGGGFAGLHAAQALKNAPVHVTLIDRRNFHLFQPLLYQVATGAVSPANIASPLREILRKQHNAHVQLAEVQGIDVQAQKVLTDHGEVPYDSLIVACGATHSYFGQDQWKDLAPGLKTIEDATEIRQRLLLAFEAAERSNDKQDIESYLSFAVVGAGPTGVELAGALGEITRITLQGNFRKINPAQANIYLIEGVDRVLPPYHPSLSAKAQQSLEQLGVTVLTKAMVKNITPTEVHVQQGDTLKVLPVRTVIWAAGVQASPLGRMLAEQVGVSCDRAGRIPVQANCSLVNHPNVFVIGDLACFTPKGAERPLPGVAPVAMQQGTYVGKLIEQRITHAQTPEPDFKYKDYGSMATIGRAAAVADMGGVRFSGFLAWLAWLVIHLAKLVGYQNRALVLMQWAWSYLTFSRPARLITATPAADAPTQAPSATSLK